MSKKIKKLCITVVRGGLRLFCPGEIEKQSITITSSGQVWWRATRSLTEEEESAGFSDNGVKMTEYKNIGREKAERILSRAEDVFKNKIYTGFESFICDACPDEVYITFEDNEVLSGQLLDLTTGYWYWKEKEDFYDYLSKELLIEDLFFFDDDDK